MGGWAEACDEFFRFSSTSFHCYGYKLYLIVAL